MEIRWNTYGFGDFCSGSGTQLLVQVAEVSLEVDEVGAQDTDSELSTDSLVSAMIKLGLGAREKSEISRNEKQTVTRGYERLREVTHERNTGQTMRFEGMHA